MFGTFGIQTPTYNVFGRLGFTVLSITISGTRYTIPTHGSRPFFRPDAPSSRTRIVADSHRTRRGVQQMSSTGRCCCDLYVAHGIIHQKHQRSLEVAEVILIFAFFANFLEGAKNFRRDFGFLCMFIHSHSNKFVWRWFCQCFKWHVRLYLQEKTTPFVLQEDRPLAGLNRLNSADSGQVPQLPIYKAICRRYNSIYECPSCCKTS